ncbi:hypothetical protein J8F10_29760 [Gemmata sp. G18]|uniref:DUF4352 domain-containing protein n=1 Tax=Gemmata palustris TaxID=2822762 RepID=A0ABS5C0E9_9BACT|nr:hypothetical protein [Gemmata palustris]MBP3959451.1 hypothetical protein [Gemmata palustris]
MPIRPLNRCDACNYTWYPQGHDLAPRCPGCGSEAVQHSWLPVVAPVLGGGLFVLLLACGGMFALFNRDDSDPPEPVAKAPAFIEKPVEGREPPAKTNPELPPNPGSIVPPGPPPISKVRPEPIQEPNTPAPLPKKEQPDPVAVAPNPADYLAPPPHALPLNRPPAGFVSEWVRCGPIQTRVVGATVTRPTLISATNNEFLAPEPVLVVWVETQSLPHGRVALRRWQNPLHNYAELKDSANAKIKAAKIPSGAWVGGQLKGNHSLPPGGAGIVDVLVFEAPAASSRDLWLGLDGANVNERDTFFNNI